MTAVRVILTCPLCGEVHSVRIADEDRYNQWAYGILLAQEAFYDLTPSEREQLISKICPECQKTIFGK